MSDAGGTRLVLLGTAGGPLPSPVRSGISQAVVVNDRVYVVDCGTGVTGQLRRARLLSQLHAVFLTHLHSDHACDYFNLFLLGWPIIQHGPPVRVYGPGSAGPMCALPEEGPDEPAIPLVNPENPTPGLVDVTEHHVRANAFDLNIRMRESGRSDLTELILPEEISVPGDLRANPFDVAPTMAPMLVHEDDAVRVTAVLVQHAPVFPAFAFRFDTDDGSIVISGDTAPCANVVALAQGADVLVHEVFNDGAPDEWDDEETWEAKQRLHHLLTSHTPLSEVGQIAARADVGRLVLTHFIPGDDTLPDAHWLGGIDSSFTGEVVVGHDLLEIPL